jgi:hypothetical protein
MKNGNVESSSLHYISPFVPASIATVLLKLVTVITDFQSSIAFHLSESGQTFILFEPENAK